MRSRLIALTMLGLASLPTSAVCAWDSEPDSFLGIRFDAPVDTQLPNCSTDRSRLCIRELIGGPTNNTAKLASLPSLGFPVVMASVWSVNGRINSISLSVNFDAEDRLFDALKVRYGPPTSTESEGYVTKRLARSSTSTSQWLGQRIIITYMRHNGDSDLGSVSASLKDFPTGTRAADEAAAGRAAEKF